MDEDSDYYTQHVAPLIDEMTGHVYGESSRGMRDDDDDDDDVQ